MPGENVALWIGGGLLGVGALALLSRGNAETNPGCLRPGETLGAPSAPVLEAGGFFEVALGTYAPGATGQTPIELRGAIVPYAGPGRDVYTAARVVQKRGGRDVTVYGSGIAGTHLPALATPAPVALVPAEQQQPQGYEPGNLLVLYPWPGPPTAHDGRVDYLANPICGQPPIAGPADLLIEVFGRCTAADADGYASVTCNRRVPITARRYSGRVVFVG